MALPGAFAGAVGFAATDAAWRPARGRLTGTV